MRCPTHWTLEQTLQRRWTTLKTEQPHTWRGWKVPPHSKKGRLLVIVTFSLREHADDGVKYVVTCPFLFGDWILVIVTFSLREHADDDVKYVVTCPFLFGDWILCIVTGCNTQAFQPLACKFKWLISKFVLNFRCRLNHLVMSWSVNWNNTSFIKKTAVHLNRNL